MEKNIEKLILEAYEDSKTNDTIVVVEKEEVKNEQYYAVRTILNPHDNAQKTIKSIYFILEFK
ncbi:Uncharacterised protein [Campylobacter jejuni subsp. doylei]|uniref:Uncharacterized protein n=1 Tax=Campylobacter jejuni subsp. doylei TaxID=32021 RepID=A0A3S4S5B3_CAMJU|nr:hypothetical protein [Campylobacter jejuni]VEG60202.1 Uncharacterised protein [Campylobacter jejuni subsp. doylei]